MRVEIKKAGITDIDLLVKWRMTVLHEVFSISPEESMEELKQENLRYYQEALLRGGHIACFAYAEGQVVGGFRGHGIGREIVSWLIGQAKQEGISKIYLEASECGRSLYQEMGFTDMCGYMKLKEKE
ncbi:MAG: GNAT family N-acetyltransferase [Eubacterium sp.]|nr:GNAT family N-acetyltransferase [Eubacterium sp.]